MTANDFVFSPRYKLWRHLSYWSVHIMVWAIFWIITGSGFSYGRQLFSMVVWTPVFILFGYPLVYLAIPRLLLQEKLAWFFVVVAIWAIIGLFINGAYRLYVYIPLQEALHFKLIWPQHGLMPRADSYLCMTTAVATPMGIKFFKLWSIKQRALMLAQQERLTAQMQLLKAQLHPHFLFNTLNNIYSFALERSSKTPGMILQLSSLLSYMLYECKRDEVLLSKEVEIMKAYIDLEKERYGDKIDISVNIEGEITDRYITPLLMLPFLENAFKHGTAEQLERPWMSVDISVKGTVLNCKVVNSKNESVPFHENGVGIANVKKRLELLYPGQHELKLADQGEFFVVDLLLQLKPHATASVLSIQTPVSINSYENPMSAHRR